MDETGRALRAVREAAGFSLSALASLVHYSKAYLSLVETGKRAATSEIVETYERVLGIGGLGEAVNRREFLSVTALAATNAKLVTELTACIASGDAGPLATVQTTYGVDMAIASILDRASLGVLHRWAEDDSDPVTRVNAAGILAKVPGQGEADRVLTVLGRDEDVRDRYLTAVVARVTSLDWSTATRVTRAPDGFPQPLLVAERLAREAVNPADADARWCSAVMLQRLSPMLGR
ncbi:helix-turn-helix domain-containing protein [Kibdelosporangium lantanae]|uniref:Helix-turn-helix domain-containing protein n=1 Tax=Kibdelosporangium lantanae TaxID=1497396 RepID=A0ABW3M4S9_9PSEU